MPACSSDAEPPSTSSPVIAPEEQWRGAPAFELTLLLDVVESSLPTGIDDRLVERCCKAALQSQASRILSPGVRVELSVQLLDSEDMQSLNRDYRDRDKPTNVLSFPSGLPLMHGDDGLTDDESGSVGEGALLVLGDLVLCPAILAKEASEQGKPLMHHWAHMLVHGCLHLCGHDHENPREADIMEGAEIRILSALGIPDPYAVEHDVDGQ